jgi:hypothetical protein
MSTRTLGEWAAAFHRWMASPMQKNPVTLTVNRSLIESLTADLEAAQAEHERELESLRERCATKAWNTDAVRAVPLRRGPR